MTAVNKVLSALAMCRGAGKLQIGFDASIAAIQKGAPLIVLAFDTAERTKRNILRAGKNRTDIIELDSSQYDIESVVGRRFVVAAVSDPNFARLVRQAYRNRVTIPEEVVT